MSTKQIALLTVVVFAGLAKPALADDVAGAKKSEAAKFDALGDPLPVGAFARFGTTRLLHGAKTVAFLNDRTIVSVGSSIRFWDAATGKLVREISLPEMDDVTEATISADGKRLITCHIEFGFRVWELTSGKLIREIDFKNENPKFSGDPKLLSVTADGCRFISRECIRNPSGPADKKRLQVTIYGAGTNAKAIRLRDSSGNVYLSGISPDGKYAVTVAEWEANNSKSKPLVFWDAATGNKLHTDDPRIGELRQIRFLPDGKSLVLVSDQYVVLRTVEGKELWRRPTEGEAPIIADMTGDRLLLVAINEDADNLRVRAVDLDNGLMVGGWRMSGGAFTAAAISADGKRVVIASGGRLYVLNLSNGTSTVPGAGHAGMVTSAKVTTDGRFVLTSGECDNDAVLWDIATGQIVRRFPGRVGKCKSVTCSVDGKWVATTSSDGTARIWEPATGRQPYQLTGFNVDAGALSWFTADGTKLAVAAGSKLGIYDFALGEKIDELDVNPDDPPRMLFNRSDGRLMALMRFVEPDKGSTEFVPNSFDLWDVRAKRVFRHFKGCGGNDWQYCISADLRTIASFGNDGLIHICEMATGKQRLSFRMGDPDDDADEISVLALSPDGVTLAGALGEEVVLWNLVTGKRFASFKAHDLCVTTLDFTPDGRRLVTGGADTTLLGWDMTRPEWRSRTLNSNLSEKDMATHWHQLRNGTGEEAYRSKWALVGDPKKTVQFLWTRVPFLPSVAAERIKSWIADLDSNQFSVRDKAQRQLQEHFDQAEGLLRKSLEGKNSVESRNRITRLIDTNFAAIPQPDQLRDLRAIEVLEQIGTPEARDLLRRLAKSDVPTAISRDAAQSLKRLEKRQQ